MSCDKANHLKQTRTHINTRLIENKNPFVFYQQWQIFLYAWPKQNESITFRNNIYIYIYIYFIFIFGTFRNKLILFNCSFFYLSKSLFQLFPELYWNKSANAYCVAINYLSVKVKSPVGWLRNSVWQLYSNTKLHILNNIIHIFTYFFIHICIKNTQTTFLKLTHQIGPYFYGF